MKLSQKALAGVIVVVIIVATLGVLTAYNFTSGNIPGKVSALNPKLGKFYERVPMFLPDQGFVWVAGGPHITLLTYQNQVIGAQVGVPPQGGWYPWFDQPEGQPANLPPGPMYTQTIYFTNRPTLANLLLGLPLSPSTLDFEAIKQLNPKVGQFYQPASPPVPRMGVHYLAFKGGQPGPSMVLGVWKGQIASVELMLPVNPSGEPWFPWLDGPKGEIFTIPGVGSFYTQHVYLRDGPSPQEVAAALPPPPPLPSVPSPPAGVKQFVLGILEWGYNQRLGGPTIEVNTGERIQIVVVNQGNEPHDYVIQGLGVKSRILAPGETQTLEFLGTQTGQFEYYCSISGHREAGMQGMFRVK